MALVPLTASLFSLMFLFEVYLFLPSFSLYSSSVTLKNLLLVFEDFDWKHDLLVFILPLLWFLWQYFAILLFLLLIKEVFKSMHSKGSKLALCCAIVLIFLVTFYDVIQGNNYEWICFYWISIALFTNFDLSLSDCFFMHLKNYFFVMNFSHFYQIVIYIF